MTSPEPSTIPWKSQFGLRTLLAAIAGVGFVCSLFVALDPEPAVQVLCLLAGLGLIVAAVCFKNWGIAIFIILPLALIAYTGNATKWVGSRTIPIVIEIRDELTGEPIGSARVARELNLTRFPVTMTGGMGIYDCHCMTYGTNLAFSSTCFARLPNDCLCIDAPGYRSAKVSVVGLVEAPTWDLKLEPQPPLVVRLRQNASK